MKLKYIIPSALFLAMGMTSCVDDLDVTPIDPSTNMTVDADALFNKCYANLAVQGNGGANGDCDIQGIDGGTSPFVRQMWNANELTTDEAICGWGDDGIKTYCFNKFDASHPMLKCLYYRLYFGVTLCNFYLSNISGEDATRTAEVRFLRAYHYFHLMDMWGNVPFLTKMSSALAPQAKREEIYAFIEEELLDCVEDMAEPGKNTYGRVDKAAAWTLLSRLYLNAEVYTGTAQWAKAAEYAKKVMDSGYYKLNTTSSAAFQITDEEGTKNEVNWSAYQMLFMGDNGQTDARYEGIFPIVYDGKKTTCWGGSLYLIASTFNSDMFVYADADKGVTAVNNLSSQTWAGNRARAALVEKFFPETEVLDLEKDTLWSILAKSGDDRALFWAKGRTVETKNQESFTSGLSVAKFTNFTTDFSETNDPTHPDADFFLMRTAEVYLTYAEALTRQNGGKATDEALAAINAVRERANAKPFETITLRDICDEWSREFYFEGRRRSDLVRFGYFGGNSDYNWEWKGGVYNGVNFSETLNIFAIPTDDMIANSNLVQNPGY